MLISSHPLSLSCGRPIIKTRKPSIRLLPGSRVGFTGLTNTARPSLSHVQNSRPRPARPIIFSKVSARPCPPHHMAARPKRHGLYMGRPVNYIGRPADLTCRPMCWPMCRPVVNGSCAYADVIYSCQLLVFRCCFFPSGFCQAAAFGLTPTTHIILLHQRLGRVASVVNHLLLLLQSPQEQQQQQHQHVLLQQLVLLQYTVCVMLLQHSLWSKDNASTSSNTLAADSQATPTAVLIPGSTSTHT